MATAFFPYLAPEESVWRVYSIMDTFLSPFKYALKALITGDFNNSSQEDVSIVYSDSGAEGDDSREVDEHDSETFFKEQAEYYKLPVERVWQIHEDFNHYADRTWPVKHTTDMSNMHEFIALFLGYLQSDGTVPHTSASLTSSEEDPASEEGSHHLVSLPTPSSGCSIKMSFPCVVYDNTSDPMSRRIATDTYLVSSRLDHTLSDVLECIMLSVVESRIPALAGQEETVPLNYTILMTSLKALGVCRIAYRANKKRRFHACTYMHPSSSEKVLCPNDYRIYTRRNGTFFRACMAIVQAQEGRGSEFVFDMDDAYLDIERISVQLVILLCPEHRDGAHAHSLIDEEGWDDWVSLPSLFYSYWCAYQRTQLTSGEI